MLKRSLLFLSLSGITYLTWNYFIQLRPVSEDEVIWVWLYAEAKDPKHKFAYTYQSGLKNVELDSPNLSNKEENERRKQLFNKVRGDYLLWRPIASSTSWYKRRILVWGPMNSIYGPYPPPREERRTTTDLNNIILWGHDKNDKLVVLEGNHRWYSRNLWFPYFPLVYVGISSQSYKVHATTGCQKCKDKNTV